MFHAFRESWGEFARLNAQVFICALITTLPSIALIIGLGAGAVDATHFAAACATFAITFLIGRWAAKGAVLTREQSAAPSSAAEQDFETKTPAGLPSRERLIATINKDVAFSVSPALLGIVRLANFDQVAAFDPPAAQRIVVEAARRLIEAVGGGHAVGYVDRDCFAIWFGERCDIKAAQRELEALGYALGRDISDGALTFSPDIQLGSALYPLDAEEPSALLSRAFVSLARPQRTADGGIAFFERPTPVAAKRRFTLEQNLRHAVRRGEFSLHYQPIVDLAMGRLSGAEALLRWERGGVSPAVMVPVMEECGLVHEIGLWTVNAACRQLREWREIGGGDFKVAVNLSARQLRDSALPSALNRIVTSHGLKANQIELELTETAAMEDANRTLLMFEQLRELGFSLAIDDFGAGYSSLSYLRRLPFQKLKIDREFVTRVDERADSRAICKALIDLTAGLEIAVLAEGVERLEEVETLAALGCPTFQGFYFSRPLDAAAFVQTTSSPDWLARMRSPARRQQDELRRRLP